MSQKLMTVAATAERLAAGARLLLAGDEHALRQLPAGTWIAGTIPYFMTSDGGLSSRDQLFVTELPADAVGVSVHHYPTDALASIYDQAPANGFSVIILPASSSAHLRFALEGPDFPGFVSKPLIGWIAGVWLEDIGKVAPLVFDGSQACAHSDGAVVMHVSLPEYLMADIGIVNLFEQNPDGHEIEFASDGFSATTARVNGEEVNLARYIQERGWDTRLPLVADYHGAMINTSFQAVDAEAGEVKFYAPVFHGIPYRHAAPVGDYVSELGAHLPSDDGQNLVFACNCILNYLYGELEGRSTGHITGPITFGEVAYQLLNQTLVHLHLIDTRNS